VIGLRAWTPGNRLAAGFGSTANDFKMTGQDNLVGVVGAGVAQRLAESQPHLIVVDNCLEAVTAAKEKYRGCCASASCLEGAY